MVEHSMKKSKIAAWVLTFAMLLATATGCKGNGTGSSSTGSMVSGEATSDSALSGSEGEDVLSGIASGLDTSDLSGTKGTSGTGTASGTGSKGNSAGNSGNPTTDTSSSGGGSNVSPSGDTTYILNVSGLTIKSVYFVERDVITITPK